MSSSFQDLTAAVERALARLGLGWGWKEEDLVLLDTAALGRGNFPARIRFEDDILKISTRPATDLLAEEKKRMQNGPAKSEETDQGPVLVLSLPIPKERSFRRARILSPLLRETLLLLSRQRLGESKAVLKEDAKDKLEKTNADYASLEDNAAEDAKGRNAAEDAKGRNSRRDEAEKG